MKRKRSWHYLTADMVLRNLSIKNASGGHGWEYVSFLLPGSSFDGSYHLFFNMYFLINLGFLISFFLIWYQSNLTIHLKATGRLIDWEIVADNFIITNTSWLSRWNPRIYMGLQLTFTYPHYQWRTWKISWLFDYCFV